MYLIKVTAVLPAAFSTRSGTARPLFSSVGPKKPDLSVNSRAACPTELAPSGVESPIRRGNARGGSAFLDLKMDAEIYFSSPVESVRFQKLRIALTETRTYIQEYRSGKANIPLTSVASSHGNRE
jgi:hypothetical protein